MKKYFIFFSKLHYLILALVLGYKFLSILSMYQLCVFFHINFKATMFT